jgi:hypothetical protein
MSSSFHHQSPSTSAGNKREHSCEVGEVEVGLIRRGLRVHHKKHISRSKQAADPSHRNIVT